MKIRLICGCGLPIKHKEELWCHFYKNRRLLQVWYWLTTRIEITK